VWDPVTGDTTAVLEGHTGGVRGVGWGEIDGQAREVSASNDRTVRVWDPVTGDTTAVLEGHTGPVLGVGWGEIDGQARVVSASYDRTVRVWDPATTEALLTIPIPRPTAIALNWPALAVATTQGVTVIDLQLTP
jgi:WD40 repeat protein